MPNGRPWRDVMPVLLVSAFTFGSGCQGMPSLHPLEKALAPTKSPVVTGAIAPSTPGDPAGAGATSGAVVPGAAPASDLLPESASAGAKPGETVKPGEPTTSTPGDSDARAGASLTSRPDDTQATGSTAQPTSSVPIVQLTEVTSVPDPNETPVSLPPAIETKDATPVTHSGPIPEAKSIVLETRNSLPAPGPVVTPDAKPTVTAPAAAIPEVKPIEQAPPDAVIAPDPKPADVSLPEALPIPDAKAALPPGPGEQKLKEPKPSESKPVETQPAASGATEPTVSPSPLPDPSPAAESKVEAPAADLPTPTSETLKTPQVVPSIESTEPDPKPALAIPEAADTNTAAASPLSEDWGSSLSRLREFATLKAEEPGESTELWKGRLRLINGMAEMSQAPKIWSSVLPALSVASNPESTEPGVLNAKLREATDAIEAMTPLEIADLRLCRKVQAFGVFEALDPQALRRGQGVILYCELVGLQSAPTAANDGFQSKLSSIVELFSAQSSQPVWSESLHKDDVCQRRRRDIYVNYRITIPANVAPGSYELKLTQTDDTTGKSVSRSIDLSVRP